MRELPENKFGYLLLCENRSKKGIYVKANKISHISYSEFNTVLIHVDDQDAICVREKIDEILEQLENIHPSLR